MSSFAITTPETNVTLSPKTVTAGAMATGTTSYSVTNQTGSAIRARLRIDVDEGADPSWFSIREGSEQEISPGSTATFSIDLSVPGTAEGGSRSFKAVAVNLADPDNDFAIGPAVGFETPALTGKEPSGIKWWMIAIPVGLLILVGAVVGLFLALNSAPTYSDYKGQELDAATASLATAGFSNVDVIMRRMPTQFIRLQRMGGEGSAENFFDKIVIGQSPDPAAEQTPKKGDTITLTWRWTPNKVTVPELKGKIIPEAVQGLKDSGLAWRFEGLPSGADRTQYLVNEFSPAGEVTAGTTIKLVVTRRLTIIRPHPNLELQPLSGGRN